MEILCFFLGLVLGVLLMLFFGGRPHMYEEQGNLKEGYRPIAKDGPKRPPPQGYRPRPPKPPSIDDRIRPRSERPEYPKPRPKPPPPQNRLSM